MLRPLPSYKKRSILPSTVSFPASSTYQDKYNALCTPCSSTRDRKSICNEQTIRFEPTPSPITRQKCCKSSITNLNFTVGVSVTCASCLGFFLPHSFPFHFSHGCMPSKVGFLSEIGWKLRSPLDRSWKFVVQEVLHEH